jgi:hypothetical protein
VVDALTAAKEAVAAALAAAALAVDKAEANAEKWRDNANEWRSAMNDREKRFQGIEEAALMNQALVARVDKLENADSRHVGRAQGISQAGVALYFTIATLIGIAALITSIVLHH